MQVPRPSHRSLLVQLRKSSHADPAPVGGKTQNNTGSQASTVQSLPSKQRSPNCEESLLHGDAESDGSQESLVHRLLSSQFNASETHTAPSQWSLTVQAFVMQPVSSQRRS